MQPKIVEVIRIQSSQCKVDSQDEVSSNKSLRGCLLTHSLVVL